DCIGGVRVSVIVEANPHFVEPGAPAVKREAEEDWDRDRWRRADPEARLGLALVRRVERRRLRCTCRRHSCRPHHEGSRRAWGLAYRWPTHGYEPTREAAMGAFAKSWRRE